MVCRIVLTGNNRARPEKSASNSPARNADIQIPRSIRTNCSITLRISCKTQDNLQCRLKALTPTKRARISERFSHKFCEENYRVEMVQSGGFEPPTFGATIRRSNQLSYDCIAPCSARFLGKLGGKCKSRNRDFPQLVKKTSPEPDSPCQIRRFVNNLCGDG